jgi:MFS family permease
MAAETSPPDTASDAQAYRSFFLVGLVLAITQLSFYLMAAALPLYLRDIGAAQSRIGLEVNLGSLFALALVFAGGPAINRYGSGVFLRLSALVFVLVSLGMFAFPQEAVVTAFRAFQGAGAALTLPSAYTLGTMLIAHRPATAISILGAVNNVALAVGPPIGLALYADFGAGGLFLPAAAAAVLGLVSTLLLPEQKIHRHTDAGFGFERRWLPVLTASTLFMIFWGGIVAYLPLFLRDVHGPNAGIFFTADAIGVLVLRIPTGILTDRHGSYLPKLVGLLVTFPGIAVLAIHPSVLTLIASGACSGVGAGFFLTGIMADLSWMSTQANRGTAMSLGGGTFNAGIFIGGVVSGFLIGPGGFNSILIFSLITSVAALPFSLWPARAANREP